MTTITVKEGNEKFIKKNFNSAKDLFIYLREVLSPVEIHLIEDVDISESLNKSSVSDYGPFLTTLTYSYSSSGISITDPTLDISSLVISVGFSNI